MTIGNLSERIGNSKKNRIKSTDGEIVYGLAGHDKLVSKNGSSIEGDETSVLVGGSDNDTYKAGKRKTTVVLDNGKSKKDTLTARGIGLNFDTSFVVEVENRHLYAGDRRSGQYVVLLDWQKSKHRIEKIQLADGTLSYQQLVQNLESFENYLGNTSWAELESLGEIDSDQLGLSPSEINGSVRTVEKRAVKLEQSRSGQSVDPLTDSLTGESLDTLGVGDASGFQASTQGSPSSSILASIQEASAIAPLSEPAPLSLTPQTNPILDTDPLAAGLSTSAFLESPDAALF